jgi:hypothetical protein
MAQGSKLTTNPGDKTLQSDSLDHRRLSVGGNEAGYDKLGQD